MSDDNPPPAKRQVVVLRAGPPKRRGIIVDAVFGILGVALLVAAVGLGNVLPEEEVPPKQFLPEFDRDAEPLAPMTDPAWPGDEPSDGELRPSLRYTDPLPEDDVREIEVVSDRFNIFQWEIRLTLPGDDIASSDPDSFSVELLAPNGTVYESTEPVVATDRPVETEPSPLNASTALYESETVSQSVYFRLPAVPTADFITSNRTDFDATDALRVASDLYTRDTQGTWTFRVSMDAAGDCPEPGASPSQIRRALACQEETEQSGEDPGNPLTISYIRYDYYTIQVPDPDDQAPGELE